MIRLDLIDKVVYNRSKNRFEFILLCDKTGNYGKKLNLKLLHDIIAVY